MGQISVRRKMFKNFFSEFIKKFSSKQKQIPKYYRYLLRKLLSEIQFFGGIK